MHDLENSSNQLSYFPYSKTVVQNLKIPTWKFLTILFLKFEKNTDIIHIHGHFSNSYRSVLSMILYANLNTVMNVR